MNEILITEKSADYELIDSGEGEKLERFGKYILRRPDPQAIWRRSLGNEWEDADAFFERTGKTGKWHKKKDFKTWDFRFDNLVFSLELLPSKHVGIFPEQVVNWKWLEEKIRKETEQGKKVSVLNLFAYTGGASLVACRAGAEVVHVDSSKFAIDTANLNFKKSGLGESKIRLIMDDVRKFVEREIKRGNEYDVVIMDPPVYGKGSKKEVWNIEEDLVPFLKKVKEILRPDPLAILLNGYSSGYSSMTYSQVLSEITREFTGDLTHGELHIKDSSDRFLPSGIFARFER